MFRKKAIPADAGGRPRWEELHADHLTKERRVAAWIGRSVVIKGDLTSSEDLTIAGRIEGDIAVPDHSVIIAPDATILGNVVARFVAVHGEVRGTITAVGRVEVGETGSVDGDIVTPRMAIAEGATLQGRVGIESLTAAV